MDFRDVTALLHNARIDIRSLNFPESRLGIAVEPVAAGAERVIDFQDIEKTSWKMVKSEGDKVSFAIIGLEKLGAGEVWRLYARTVEGAELELSCRRILCDGEEVTGVGRSYRH